MTILNEEKRAIKMAERFLLRLVDPKQTPRISKTIRHEAAGILRHFPTSAIVEIQYGLVEW